jgi:hypothetical protein
MFMVMGRWQAKMDALQAHNNSLHRELEVGQTGYLLTAPWLPTAMQSERSCLSTCRGSSRSAISI